MKSKTIIVLLAVLLAVSLGFNFFSQGSGSGETTATAQSGEKQLWTCGMHPNVVLDHPGICPICEMNLTPLKSDNNKEAGVVSVDPATLQTLGVRTAPVGPADLSRAIRTNGRVIVDESRTFRVNPKVSGWIEKLYADKTGEQVRAGQPLFDFYSPALVSAQEEYLLALASTKIAEQSGVASLQNSSRKMLEAVRDRLINWDFTEAQIRKLEERGSAERLVTFSSPANGVVMEKSAVEGARVTEGMDLFRIADLSAIWIEADVYEYELPWVEVGSAATLSVPYDPTVKITSHVNYIYPYLSPSNRTAKVRMLVDNPEFMLKPDMYVDVVIEARSRSAGVAVPREAVIRSGRRDLVFIAKGEGKFEPREIQLGLEADNGLFEVAAGLLPGEIVVISAQFLLDSERQLQEALDKLLAGGGSEADLHKAMGHEHGSMSELKSEGGATTTKASGRTMEALFESDTLFACPDHDHIITAESNTHCPHDQMPLVQMTLQEIETLRASDPYGCVMCPVIHPGDEQDERCSICNMKLKPVPHTSAG